MIFGASLFSGAGIGDLGVRKAGIELLVSNELLIERAKLLEINHPNTQVITGDAESSIDQILSAIEDALEARRAKELFALFATPPCQGMSQNGLGKLLNNVRNGKRPELDPRNQLILSALTVAKKVRPTWVVFENVPGMRYTVIDYRGTLMPILDVIPIELGPEYNGQAYTVEFADYGLPQTRQRLITVFTRDFYGLQLLKNGQPLIPEATHSKYPSLKKLPWVTLREAIGDFPRLNGKSANEAQDPSIPLHKVPVLDPKKYIWIRHTPENGSAFDNQCVNPRCLYKNNPKHGASRGNDGINRAKDTTPLFCIKCGELLPRPYVKTPDGSMRFMRGYTSAYKRMSWKKPASTITQNLRYPSSDHTLHPDQNRVLSLAEVSKLQSLTDYGYKWGPIQINNEKYDVAHDTTIAECIGESVPPMFMEKLSRHIINISKGEIQLKMAQQVMSFSQPSLSNPGLD